MFVQIGEVKFEEGGFRRCPEYCYRYSSIAHVHSTTSHKIPGKALNSFESMSIKRDYIVLMSF